jgi:hypothetical protein
VVANAAYPAQSGAGIHTVLARGTHIDVVRIVPDAIASSGRVNATIYTDAELGFVNDAGAGGVSEYRKHLEDLLAGLPHEQIIVRMDAVAACFRALIVKTQMRTPHTSVFLELGCGYWSAVRSAPCGAGSRHPGNEPPLNRTNLYEDGFVCRRRRLPCSVPGDGGGRAREGRRRSY